MEGLLKLKVSLENVPGAALPLAVCVFKLSSLEPIRGGV